MKLSILTPVHPQSLPYLAETFASLAAQTHAQWEWVLVPNLGVDIPHDFVRDGRVRVVPFQFPPRVDGPDGERHAIGEVKRFAAGQATGEVLVELDADDILTADALSEIVRAFADERVMLAYSNSAEFRHGTWAPHAYSDYWGWRSRSFEYQGHGLREMVAWEPGPHMLRHIWWSPNHVRAWRASAYWQVGGHNPHLAVADDQELNIRFYLAYGDQGFCHIDRCLYLYRVHDANSVARFNGEIQEATHWLYRQNIGNLAIRWAQDHRLRLLDLGGRFNAWDVCETVDLLDADIRADLNRRWPFRDNSVGVVRASHIFEHLRDPIHAMNESYRVLAPGGFLFVEVPSTEGLGAFQDPTHISFWNERSFWYYTRNSHAQYIRPRYKGRFQVSLLETYMPDWGEASTPLVRADLIALKPPYSLRPVGETLI